MLMSAEDPARLRLVASAIAGRPVDVAACEPGAAPWTDGATIFLDASWPAGDQLRALAVQASLLGAGSLEPDVLRTLARRPGLARRYLSVEGRRALQTRSAFLPPPVWPLVDPTMAARSASPAESLALAAGRLPLVDPPPVFGVIRPGAVTAVAAAAAASAAPGEQAAQHVPRRHGRVDARELDEDEDVAPGVDLFSSPVGGGGGIGKLLKRLFGEGRSPSAGPPGADAPTRRSRRSAGVSPLRALSTVPAAVPDAAGSPLSPGEWTYPEWDANRARYRPEWCRVTEVVPSDLGRVEVPDTHRLRRSLARLGTELERRHRQPQGDDVDIDAAVEARVEALAGSAPDEAVYIDSLRCRRDLSVLVLLDVSGSAGLPGARGVPVHEHQRAAAAMLSVTLAGLGDRVALYGFRSQGRSAVQVLVVKRFDDAMGSQALARLGGFVPGAYTRLGAAVRHGTAVLERDGGTARRLLVVLSDGLAYDHGYERAHGEADARRALAEARRRGIGCLCLSVGAASDADALRRVFGSAAYAAVPGAGDLAAVAGPLWRAALASADLRRRVWQRRARSAERLVVERRTA